MTDRSPHLRKPPLLLRTIQFPLRLEQIKPRMNRLQVCLALRFQVIDLRFHLRHPIPQIVLSIFTPNPLRRRDPTHT
jgi:hypothetical protein